MNGGVFLRKVDLKKIVACLEKDEGAAHKGTLYGVVDGKNVIVSAKGTCGFVLGDSDFESVKQDGRLNLVESEVVKKVYEMIYPARSTHDMTIDTSVVRVDISNHTSQADTLRLITLKRNDGSIYLAAIDDKYFAIIPQNCRKNIIKYEKEFYIMFSGDVDGFIFEFRIAGKTDTIKAILDVAQCLD